MSHTKSFMLLLLFLLCHLCFSWGWSWTGDTIDVDSAVRNMAFFNEGSGDTSEEGAQEIAPTSSASNKESKFESAPSTQQSPTSVESNYGDRIRWTKGDKGEPGEQGPKGECVKEFSAPDDVSQLSSCSCNISQLVNNYGDILRGLKGDIGPRGHPGPTGLPGVPGPPGPPGPPSSHGRENSFDTVNGVLMEPSLTYMGGRINEPGPPGPRGLPGHKGEKGIQGIGGNKGDKGERGKRGKTGKPGIRGPPGPTGPKGDDVRIADIKKLMLENDIKGVKGDTGLPGPPGPPGPVLYDSWSDNSLNSRSRHYRGKMYDRMSGGSDAVYIEGPPGPPGPKGEPGTGSSDSTASVTVMKDIEQLQQATLNHPEGALVFVLSEQTLLIRIKNGWQYISLANTLVMPEGISLIKTNSDATSPEPSVAIGNAEIVESSRHVTHNRKLRMAALNQPFTGDMHGVRGADYECFRQSRRANLKGTFRAFIASRVQNLDSIVRLKDSKLPVVNLRDEILFNSWRDLFTGAGAPFPYPPKIYSFDGRNIFTDATWSQKLVWHGADKDGVRNTDAYCDAWGSNAISRMGVASNLLRGKLLDQEKYSCNNAFIALCVEVTPEESATRHRRQSDLSP